MSQWKRTPGRSMEYEGCLLNLEKSTVYCRQYKWSWRLRSFLFNRKHDKPRKKKTNINDKDDNNVNLWLNGPCGPKHVVQYDTCHNKGHANIVANNGVLLLFQDNNGFIISLRVLIFFFFCESPFICKLYKYIQQTVYMEIFFSVSIHHSLGPKICPDSELILK
jgi:hypothetical protein